MNCIFCVGDRHKLAGKTAPGVQRTLNAQGRVMALQYMLNDGEAQTGANASVCANNVNAKKALGKTVEILGRDAAAIIHDGQSHAIAVILPTDFNILGTTVANGVAQ